MIYWTEAHIANLSEPEPIGPHLGQGLAITLIPQLPFGRTSPREQYWGVRSQEARYNTLKWIILALD